MLRVSEVVAVDVEHVYENALFVPRSKTDQEGQGVYLYLTDATGKYQDSCGGRGHHWAGEWSLVSGGKCYRPRTRKSLAPGATGCGSVEVAANACALCGRGAG